MRLGILGGSFDPVHRGHLRLAETALSQARLDRVLLMPAARQPLKPSGPQASDQDRLKMLELSLEGLAGIAVEPLEIDRGGVSYTCDTLRELARREPAAELYFVLGSDALAELPKWREPETILRLAIPLVVARPESPPLDLGALQTLASPARLMQIAATQLVMDPLPISSSDIRRRIAAGEPWKSLTPPGVASYIERRGLYARQRS